MCFSFLFDHNLICPNSIRLQFFFIYFCNNLKAVFDNNFFSCWNINTKIEQQQKKMEWLNTWLIMDVMYCDFEWIFVIRWLDSCSLFQFYHRIYIKCLINFLSWNVKGIIRVNGKSLLLLKLWPFIIGRFLDFNDF